jgi:hypothetical protein
MDIWLRESNKERYHNNGNVKKHYVTSYHVKVKKGKAKRKDNTIGKCPKCRRLRELTTDHLGKKMCPNCFLKTLA